jgi:hypothetical protein
MLNASQLIVKIVAENSEIAFINLFRPRMSPPIQNEGGLSLAELDLIENALRLRSSISLPFWDCLLLRMSNSPADAPVLLKTAQRHNPQSVSSEKLSRRDVRQDVLDSKISKLGAGTVLAVSSRIECHNGKVMHLPLLDFHCGASSKNDLLVRSLVQNLNLHGYIAHSGRSYHFYGSHLVDDQNLMMILARALLFAPIIDRAWIAHQLIEGACGLRISPGKEYSHGPIVIDQT